MALDASGNWAKMPRVLLAKCANMVALCAGWREIFAGAYAEEEMDRAKVQDRTASEMVEMEREQRRMKVISALEDEFGAVDATGNLSYIPAGRYGDHILEMARLCETVGALDALQNRDGLQRLWSKHMSDALRVKKEMEAIRTGLLKKVPA
jgi:hypothetical protein